MGIDHRSSYVSMTNIRISEPFVKSRVALASAGFASWMLISLRHIIVRSEGAKIASPFCRMQYFKRRTENHQNGIVITSRKNSDQGSGIESPLPDAQALSVQTFQGRLLCGTLSESGHKHERINQVCRVRSPLRQWRNGYFPDDSSR